MTRRIVKVNLMSVATAVAILAICSDLHAQRRPFQLGGPRGLTAGGGQGFRLGGNFGIRAGGGQGTTIGGPNFGMHFGNGRGAHFGGPNFGMQFGGGQGVQIGRLNGNQAYPQQSTAYPQGTVYPQNQTQIQPQQPTLAPQVPTNASQTGINQSNAYAEQVYGQSTVQPTTATNDVARANVEKQSTRTANQTSLFKDMIRVTLPETAKTRMNYTLNGTRFALGPGDSINMAGKQSWTIGFSPSKSSGIKEYTLDQPGQFLFQKTDAGWDLVRADSSAAETTDSEIPLPDVSATESSKIETPKPVTESEPASVLERVDADKNDSDVEPPVGKDKEDIDRH